MQIHLHSNRSHHDLNIFLLLIPSIVFAIILLTFLVTSKSSYKEQVATINEPNVLGETNLDNRFEILPK